MAIIWLALFIPRLATSVRCYRDAGLRGRGVLVFWVILVASSYTEVMSSLQGNSGSAVFTFLTYAIGSAMSISGGANETDVLTSKFGSGIFPLSVMGIVGIVLFIPSLAMSVRRYRDAGLRGRGFLVLWVISVASSYTEIMSTLQHNGGSAIFTFLTYAIGLLFFILTVLPTNAITTKSNNEFIRFFLREKE